MFNWNTIFLFLLFFLPTGHGSISAESDGSIFFTPAFLLEHHAAAEEVEAQTNPKDVLESFDFSFGHNQKSDQKKNKIVGLFPYNPDLSGHQTIRKRCLSIKPISQIILLIIPSYIHSFSLASGPPFRINDIVTLMHAYRC